VYTHHEVTAASYADVARMYFLDSDRVDSLDQRMQMNFPAKL